MPLYDCGDPDCEECERAFKDRARAVENYHERERQYALLEKQMPKDETPPCRVCRSRHDVSCYPDDHSKTICPECCGKGAEHADGETGHVFEYARGEGWTCNYCGTERNPSNYDYSED